MLFPTPAEWAEWGIQDECHQFFCLHWTELFDPHTPDTWQVRSCNVKTILRELIDASQIAHGFDAYRGVMRSILDEAFAVFTELTRAVDKCIVCRNIFENLCKKKSFDSSMKLAAKISDSRLKDLAFEQIITGLCQNSNVHQAIALINEIRFFDIKNNIYFIIINTLCKNKLFDKALSLISKVYIYFTPDKIDNLLFIVIEAICTNNDINDLERIAELVNKISNNNIKDRSLHNLIKTLCIKNKFNEALCKAFMISDIIKRSLALHLIGVMASSAVKPPRS